MIHYTPLAIEEILANPAENTIERMCIEEAGKMLYVDKQVSGDYRIVQLVSTNPDDYLNADYTPGSMLNITK